MPIDPRILTALSRHDLTEADLKRMTTDLRAAILFGVLGCTFVRAGRGYEVWKTPLGSTFELPIQRDPPALRGLDAC